MAREVDRYASSRFLTESDAVPSDHIPSPATRAFAKSKGRNRRGGNPPKARSSCRVLLSALLALTTIIVAYIARWGAIFRQPLAIAVLGCHILNAVCVFQPTISFDISVICDASMCAKLSEVPDIEQLDTRVRILEDANVLPEDKPRRNFALLSGGAKVIPELTSLTKGLPRHDFFASLLVWARGHDPSDIDVNLPTIVLEGGRNNHGECWEFHGKQGHIAIQLSGLVYISGIGIYHAPPEVVSYADSMKTPKNITLWGLSTEALRSLPVTRKSGTNSQLQIPGNFVTMNRPISYPIQPSDMFVPLLNFQYNSTIGGLQSFMLPDDAHIGCIGFNVVIVEVRSSLGSDSTCIYQVEIHGSEV